MDKEKLKELVDAFRIETKGKKDSSKYDEENVKTDYINKFFELLGWDVTNKQGLPLSQKEVEFETTAKTHKGTKKPDYGFRYAKSMKFYVEAKKPSVNIYEDIDAAYQVRSYGFSQQMPLCILTDFEEFSVYDTRLEPGENDNAKIGRIKYFTFEEYLKEEVLNWIYNTFSKEAVAKGSIEKYAEETKKPKGTISIDTAFLNTIDNWRLDLAKELANRNKDLSIYELNEAVQKIIDRLLFLRVAEDRGAEEYETLLNCIKTTNVKSALYKIFANAEKKYNSGLFKKSGLIQSLDFDENFLKKLIRGTYPRKCPFRFNVMPIEIIGAAYEQFLGKTIRLTDSHRAKIEYKPEVRKAGGVYYTPQYIVDYIVKNTVGEKIKDKTPKQIEKITILDPACGSGSFLVGAYTHLLKYHLDYYTKDKNKEKALKNNCIFEYEPGEYYLTIDEKRKILLNNIYGVDIDFQATEVTKLSLLLKLLEHENKDTIDSFLKHSDMQPMPDLSDNIKCGNSLISSDFYEMQETDSKGNLKLFEEESERKINVFDWDAEGTYDNETKTWEGRGFPQIFHNEVSKFHHITFETKYSRKRVKGKDPVILTDEERITVADAIAEKAEKGKFKITAASILPDHVHLIIADMGEDIEKIVKDIKGYSAHTVNRRFKSSVQGEGYQMSLWAKSYNNSFLDTEVHLVNAINYVNKNNEKNADTWGETPAGLNAAIASFITPFKNMRQFEYRSGGFDVVIGNPPYYSLEVTNDFEKKYLKKFSKVFTGKSDILYFFIEKAIKLLKDNALMGYITSRYFFEATYAEMLRNFIFKNSNIKKIVDFQNFNVFKGVGVHTAISIISKSKYNDTDVYILKTSKEINTISDKDFKHFKVKLSGKNWILADKEELSIVNKIKNKFKKLENFAIIEQGQKTGLNRVYTIDGDFANKLENEPLRKLIKNSHIERYHITFKNKYLIYADDNFKLNKYPKIKKYFEDNKSDLKNRAEAKDGLYNWYRLQRPRNKNLFDAKEKIVVPYRAKNNCFALDDKQYYNDGGDIRIIVVKEEIKEKINYLLGLLNSKLINFYYTFIGRKKGNMLEYFVEPLSKIPIPSINFSNPGDKKKHDDLVSLVDNMLAAQEKYHSSKSENDRRLYKRQIHTIDKQIDSLVYSLYGLTDDEIALVEVNC